MATQLTIFFDKPEIRRQFLRDIEGLIVYYDQTSREECDRMNYEDTLSFYMPDIDQDNRSPENDPSSRMNLLSAEMAVNPAHYYHLINTEA